MILERDDLPLLVPLKLEGYLVQFIFVVETAPVYSYTACIQTANYVV